MRERSLAVGMEQTKATLLSLTLPETPARIDPGRVPVSRVPLCAPRVPMVCLRLQIALCCLAIPPAAAWARETGKATPEQVQFFEAKVRPILVANCQKCHSGKESKGDLHLDSRDGLL